MESTGQNSLENFPEALRNELPEDQDAEMEDAKMDWESNSDTQEDL